MAERGTEKMTEWLDITLDTLSSEERIRLIEEICETLTPQELLTIRDQVERRRENKLDGSKSGSVGGDEGEIERVRADPQRCYPFEAFTEKQTCRTGQIPLSGWRNVERPRTCAAMASAIRAYKGIIGKNI